MNQPQTFDVESKANELMSLPPSARLALAENLIDSVPVFADATIESAWSNEIERRLQELESSAVAGIPSEEAHQQIRQET